MKKHGLALLLALALLMGCCVLSAKADGPSQPSFPSVTPEQAAAFLDMIETYSNAAPIYTNLGDIETTVHALVFNTGDGTPALLLAKGYGTPDPPAAEPDKVVYRLGEANIFSFREGALDPYFGNTPGSFTVYPDYIGVEFGTTDRITYQEHRFSHLAPGGGIAETADATFARKLDARTLGVIYTIDGLGADEQLYQETLNGWLGVGTVASAVQEGESRFVMTGVPQVAYTVEQLKRAQNGESVAGVDLGPSWWAAEEVNAAVALGMVQDTMQSNWQAEITRGEFARLAVSFLAVQYGYGNRPLDVFMEDYLDKAVDPQGAPFQKSDYLTEEHRAAYEQGAFYSWAGILREDMEAFSDVASDGCKNQINMAYLLGVIQGVGDGRYAPDAPITRQEAATLLSRAYQVYAALETAEQSAVYMDQAQIAPWAAESVAVMQSWNVLRGDETGTFHPLDKLTEEQAVATFYRLYQNMPVSRRQKNIPALFTPEEVVQQIKADIYGQVKFEAETSYCTVIFMTYGGTMRPATPSAYLVYPDSTCRRVEVPSGAKDFHLAEASKKLTFSTDEGKKYLLDLLSGALTETSWMYERALLEGSVAGFYYRPFEELPQELRDSLKWDGKIEAPEGWNFLQRTYTAPGITIVTIEAREEVLRAWVDSQLALPVEQREGQFSDAALVAEFEREEGREWLYTVTLTDGRYSTALGLTVGDTVAEAEEKGYDFSPEQLQAGGNVFGMPVEISLSVIVENNIVTKFHLSFGNNGTIADYIRRARSFSLTEW